MADATRAMEEALASATAIPDLSRLTRAQRLAGAKRARAREIESAVETGMWVAALLVFDGLGLRPAGRLLGISKDTAKRRALQFAGRMRKGEK